MTPRQKQKETARRYAAMVAAVRAWIELACPCNRADQLTLYRSWGDNHEELAHFHAGESQWTRGDLMAGHRI